jgi:hypothetical protein
MNQEKNQKNQENKKWLTLLAGKEVAEVDLELIGKPKYYDANWNIVATHRF